MIQIKGVKKSFGDNQVLQGVDLNIEKGEIVTMIGPSGAGKTTLLRSLNWLDPPDEGIITIGDVSINARLHQRRTFPEFEVSLQWSFNIIICLQIKRYYRM